MVTTFSGLKIVSCKDNSNPSFPSPEGRLANKRRGEEKRDGNMGENGSSLAPTPTPRQQCTEHLTINLNRIDIVVLTDSSEGIAAIFFLHFFLFKQSKTTICLTSIVINN